MGLLVSPDSVSTPVEPKDGKAFRGEEMQDYVGGYFERHELVGYTFSAMYMAEFGNMKKMAYNPNASVILAEYGGKQQPVVGTVLLMTQAEEDAGNEDDEEDDHEDDEVEDEADDDYAAHTDVRP